MSGFGSAPSEEHSDARVVIQRRQRYAEVSIDLWPCRFDLNAAGQKACEEVLLAAVRQIGGRSPGMFTVGPTSMFAAKVGRDSADELATNLLRIVHDSRYQQATRQALRRRTNPTERTTMSTALHKQGDRFAIVTTAPDEIKFREEFAQACAEMIESGEYDGDWPFHLDGWLAQASEIICKLRGYKSSVTERRTLLAGVLDPDAEIISAGRREFEETAAETPELALAK